LLSVNITRIPALENSSIMMKLIRRAMIPDADETIEAFGKNEQVKKMFWALFAASAGVIRAQPVDPVTAQQIAGIITGAVV